MIYGREISAHIVNEAEGRGLEFKVHIVVGALDERWRKTIWLQARHLHSQHNAKRGDKHWDRVVLLHEAMPAGMLVQGAHRLHQLLYSVLLRDGLGAATAIFWVVLQHQEQIVNMQ